MKMHAMRELTGLLRQLRLAIEAEGRAEPAMNSGELTVEELIAAPAWAFDTPPASQVYMEAVRGDRLAA
jgi:hypothetical protein